MSRINWIIVIIVIVSLVGLEGVLVYDHFRPEGGTDSFDDIATVTFPEGEVIYADIADDIFSRKIGLSEHDQLDSQSGMLFLHEEKARYTYWMKGMSFPIDIIWLDGSIVVGFSEKLPLEDPPVTMYSPDVPVDRVLEVQAGFVEEIGLLPGDRLDIKLATQ